MRLFQAIIIIFMVPFQLGAVSGVLAKDDVGANPRVRPYDDDKEKKGTGGFKY